VPPRAGMRWRCQGIAMRRLLVRPIPAIPSSTLNSTKVP